MKVIVVDKEDNIIGYKDRYDRNPNDIIRIAGLWMFNSKGEVLIAQRAINKQSNPGKWTASVGGTLEEGETYLTNIIKETKEEVGVSVEEKDLIVGPHRMISVGHNCFCQAYFTKIDLPESSFVLQKEEVEKVRWISIDDLLAWSKEKPEDFAPFFQSTLDDYLEFANLK
jgi:isopentenyl-diphosphate delta-isomerase